MGKQQKQIEEILEKVGVRYGMDVGGISYIVNAHKLALYLQPKIPETAIVILDEEMEDFAETLAKSPQIQKVISSLIKSWQKETAEKLMNEISGDILTVNTKEYGNIEVIPVERFQEICTNVIEGN